MGRPGFVLSEGRRKIATLPAVRAMEGEVGSKNGKVAMMWINIYVDLAAWPRDRG
jgi:hypothetical protein